MIMSCLDLDGLKIFVAVAEASSFSRAADAVGRTQPAVSRQMARLEQSLGKMLIHRRQGHVLGLTDDGRELLAYARRIVELNDAAFRAVAQPATSGRVRLGVPADFMDAAFPEVLRSFQHAHGAVELEVVSDVSERLRERLRQGLLDVAFFKRLPGPGDGTVIDRQRLLWVGATPGVVPAEDLPLSLVLFPEGCVFRAQALKALDTAGRCWRLAYVCPSFESVHAAIRSGLGIGVLPDGPAIHDLADLGGEGLPLLDAVDLVMVTGRDGGRAARLLADHIGRHLRMSRM